METSLPLQVGQRHDAGIGARNDPDLVGKNGRDDAKFLERRVETGGLVALPRIDQAVAQCECDLATTDTWQVEIPDQGRTRMDGGLESGITLPMTLARTTLIGQLTQLVPPVNSLIKRSAANYGAATGIPRV